MMRCASSYRVFINGKWVRFASFDEAQAAEDVELTKPFRAAKAAGRQVILTTDIAEKVALVEGGEK